MTKPDFEKAACKGADTNIFFPDLVDGVGKKNKEKECRAFCANCPIQLECLVYACENEEFWGVWGGVSEAIRRKLAKSKEYDLWVARECVICGGKFMPTMTKAVCCSWECSTKNNTIKSSINRKKAKERIKNG